MHKILASSILYFRRYPANFGDITISVQAQGHRHTTHYTAGIRIEIKEQELDSFRGYQMNTTTQVNERLQVNEQTNYNVRLQVFTSHNCFAPTNNLNCNY